MMTKEICPKVTVLMTVYNGGQYLKNSIGSVLKQTFTNFEFLIVNDASTDNSLEVIESFDDNRIRIHSNEGNKGQAKSLNIGLKLAKGKYVARIDADDLAFPKWLEDQCRYIEENPEYAVVSTKAVVIDENNKIRRIYDSPARQEDIILRSFSFSPINHVGSLLNKEIVLDNGGYVEGYKIAADYGLWSALIRNGFKMTSTKKILVAIRAHSSSLSQSASGEKELQDLSDIMRENINTFTDSRILPEESILICKAFFDEGNLSDGEFDQAKSLIKRVYAHLIPSLNKDKKHVQKWSDNRCMAAYLKRIFYFIKREEFSRAKDVLKTGIEEFGYLTPLGVVFVARCLGKACLAGIPVLTDKLMNIKANCVVAKRIKLERVG